MNGRKETLRSDDGELGRVFIFSQVGVGILYSFEAWKTAGRKVLWVRRSDDVGCRSSSSLHFLKFSFKTNRIDDDEGAGNGKNKRNERHFFCMLRGFSKNNTSMKKNDPHYK